MVVVVAVGCGGQRDCSVAGKEAETRESASELVSRRETNIDPYTYSAPLQNGKILFKLHGKS